MIISTNTIFFMYQVICQGTFLGVQYQKNGLHWNWNICMPSILCSFNGYLYSFSISVTIMFLQGYYGQPAVRSNSEVYGEHYYSQLFVCLLSPSWFVKMSYVYLSFNSPPLVYLSLKHLWFQSTEALRAIRFLVLFLQS